MTYYLELRCRDCYEEDPAGCFGGESDLGERAYDTPEQASERGEALCDGPPWAYRVLNEARAWVRLPREDYPSQVEWS